LNPIGGLVELRRHLLQVELLEGVLQRERVIAGAWMRQRMAARLSSAAESCVHLAHPPVVEADAHGCALAIGPLEGLRVRHRRQADEAAYGETDTVQIQVISFRA
jgi:hypothetical protein